MRTLLLALAIAGAAVRPALAGPCVALDYQEMKDMAVNDLVVEACKARAVNDGNFKEMMSNLEATRIAKPFPEAEQNQSQCNNQVDRMLRILKSRGITDKLYALCEQQAAGKVIQAPAAPSK